MLRKTLRDVRIEQGKTQTQMAKLLGVDQTEVSRRERKPDTLISSLHAYAKALGMRCEVAFVPRRGKRIVIVLENR
jgi:transcriptional regulator with XRE-family HTH domain